MDAVLAWLGMAVIILWSWFWYWMGTKSYNHNEWNRGYKRGKWEASTSAYRRGLETGLKVEPDSLKGKVVDPNHPTTIYGYDD